MKTNFLATLLLTALLMGCASSGNKVVLTVENPGSTDRENQMAEVSWSEIEAKLGRTEQGVILVNSEGKQLPWQIVTAGTDQKSVIFPVSLKAGEKWKLSPYLEPQVRWAAASASRLPP